MDDTDFEPARAAIENILNGLGIARVVFVDDANGEGVLIEDVIAAAQSLDAEALKAALPELGESVPSDQDVIATRIRQVWRELEPKIQEERSEAIVVAARLADGSETDDLADVSILNHLIATDRLISLSPSQWETQNHQLLQESRATRTLFLFDRDFSGGGSGDTEGGIKIIASLLARDDLEGFICGLLTHTVTPENQPQQWVALSEDHSIPRDRFIVIPKLFLSQQPSLFAQALKFAALTNEFTELKRKTKDIMMEAATIAAGRIDEVSIYDLDHIVFQISANEGLWEPDMLFRLHALFHRLESRRLAHDGGVLEGIAAKLRAVSGIPTGFDGALAPNSAWTLQQEELYERDDYINRNHLPLELGDIFERVDAETAKKYILLAQPCDLMVRGNGKRQPEIERFPLVEIVPSETPPHYSEEAPYFGTSPAEKWFVKMKAVHFVRSYILDLCVFKADGTASISVNGDAPQNMRPAWGLRHTVLSRLWSKTVRKAEALAPAANESNAAKQIREKIARDLGGVLFDDDLFKGNLVNLDGIQTVTFNLKRVGRLSRARAIGLLMGYTSYLGRPAYDRSFVG